VEAQERRARLEQLFDRHAADVRAYALRRIDAETAADVVMDVFVVACRRLEDVPADPLPWLLACARRVLANQRRAARRAEALHDRMAQALGRRGHDGAAAARLAAALDQLSESDREIVLLAAWEGLTPGQIGRVVGCSRGAAAVRLHRARRRLETALRAGAAVRGAHGESTMEVL
jgi:RNA polymerase sigma-70 factor (ECF subfamily)